MPCTAEPAAGTLAGLAATCPDVEVVVVSCWAAVLRPADHSAAFAFLVAS